MSSRKRRETDQIGRPIGTAQHHLRRLIMFDLVKRLNLDTCFRCNAKIENVSQLSIEHKEPWLDNDPKLFWDLDNIAFSHLSCNIKAARKTNRIVPPANMEWCWGCKQFRSIDKFPAGSIKRRICTQCDSAKRTALRSKTGKR